MIFHRRGAEFSPSSAEKKISAFLCVNSLRLGGEIFHNFDNQQLGLNNQMSFSTFIDVSFISDGCYNLIVEIKIFPHENHKKKIILDFPKFYFNKSRNCIQLCFQPFAVFRLS
jgi:hypothetical protein